MFKITEKIIYARNKFILATYNMVGVGEGHISKAVTFDNEQETLVENLYRMILNTKEREYPKQEDYTEFDIGEYMDYFYILRPIEPYGNRLTSLENIALSWVDDDGVSWKVEVVD